MTLELGQREKERNREEERKENVGVVVGLGTRDTHLPTRLADETPQPPFLGSFLGEIRDKERDRASLLVTFKTV